MSETVAAGQLRAIIERIERVEDEIKELNADKSEIYKEARGVGFDVKAIRQCVAARKLDSAEREERDAIFDLYWSALNGSSRVHMHEDRNSTAPDRNGANMENDDVDGSAAARTEASEDVVALTGQVETPTKAEMIDETASLAAREGEKPLHSFSHSSAPTSSPETTDESPAPSPNPAPGSPSPDEDGPPAFLLKDRQPLRPLCLNPSECAGYGRHTCHRCLTAAGQSEAAA